MPSFFATPESFHVARGRVTVGRVRVLFASTRGAGHFNPLVPFLDAARRLGHEVLVAGPTGLRPVVARTDYPFHECADPAEEDIRPVWARVQTVSA